MCLFYFILLDPFENHILHEKVIPIKINNNNNNNNTHDDDDDDDSNKFHNTPPPPLTNEQMNKTINIAGCISQIRWLCVINYL